MNLGHNFNYRLLPEWHPQRAIMLTWPSEHTIWVETMADIENVFAMIAKLASQRENVIISCYDEQHQKHIRQVLQNKNIPLENISIFIAPCDDIWVRDHGPLSVYDQKNALLLLDFIFNGWGNKYPSALDNQITGALNLQSAFDKTHIHSIDMVLEGGAIEVDGHGTLLTTSSCLLAETRNPHMTKDEIAARLTDLFGLKKILWLDYGYLAGDDTDGHIDTLARFVDAETICYITCDDDQDEHFSELKKMETQLKTFTNYKNEPYKLIPLPWPKAKFSYYDQRRLPATYANFLIINDAVLVPTYEDPADSQALEILAQCFPERKIVAVNCMPVIQWYGSLHCMTMQLATSFNGENN